MRDLKFRVWDGKEIHENIELGDGDDGYFSWGYLTDKCEVMQYIGLKDKKGAPIFEGDILSRYDGEEILLIQYCEEYAKFGGLVYLQDDREPEQDSWYWFDDNVADVSEVIGNYHENSDLLLPKKQY